MLFNRTIAPEVVEPVLIPNSEGWRCTMLTVGPAEARTLLERNTGNRKLSKVSAVKYAAAMRAGDWKPSPEPLIFAPNGRLLNGQTRLHAVIAADQPQVFMAVYGVPESTFSVLDRGRPRSLADAHQAGKQESEVARLLATIVFQTRHRQVLDSDFLTILPLIRELHANLIAVCGASTKFFSSSPVRAAAIARVLAGEDQDYVYALYRNLVLGHTENLPPAGHVATRYVRDGKWAYAGGGEADTALYHGWQLFSAANGAKTRLLGRRKADALADIRTVLLQAIQDSANV